MEPADAGPKERPLRSAEFFLHLPQRVTVPLAVTVRGLPLNCYPRRTGTIKKIVKNGLTRRKNSCIIANAFEKHQLFRDES